MNPLYRRFFLIALLPLLLGGCSSQKWWVGKWEVDKEYTQQKFEDLAAKRKPEAGETGKFLSGLGDLLGGVFTALLNSSGMTMQITDKEVMTMRGGTGETASYEVMEKPTENSVLIKRGDGEITTWYLEEGRIGILTSGSSQMKIYFRKVDE